MVAILSLLGIKNKLLSNIISHGIKYDKSTKISVECKDLIWKLLTKDPNSRIDMFQVLNHPWFTMTYEAIGVSRLAKENAYLKINFSAQDKEILDPYIRSIADWTPIKIIYNNKSSPYRMESATLAEKTQYDPHDT